MLLRTCVGCRRKAEKQELVRIVFQEDGLIADDKGKLPGRGAYLCSDKKCLEKAQETGSLSRALRTRTDSQVKGFAEIIEKRK